ncbi:Trm112 family protein [Rhodococcus sp. WMMA185]|uniref:Trm112 family protein n=1 Tax=Rhodococcus sp. WMMA185 TaxID=679318 RepID=UPI0008785B34|nr:Trm112 family protein [Rhodococcus sp. WMMA185]
MALDATLLGILACPQDKGPLLLVGEELLYNPRLRRAYPIENGIPVLLIDEARDVDAEEHESLLARGQGNLGQPDGADSGPEA